MTVVSRRIASVILIVAGIALAIFYLALIGIADCSTACIERGERAPAVALIGAGVGLIVWGALLLRARPERALAWGLIVGGAPGVLASLYYLALGAGGIAWGTLVLAAGVTGAGMVVHRRAARLR